MVSNIADLANTNSANRKQEDVNLVLEQRTFKFTLATVLVTFVPFDPVTRPTIDLHRIVHACETNMSLPPSDPIICSPVFLLLFYLWPHAKFHNSR